MTYGEPPIPICEYALDAWTEFMHFLYMPVRMPQEQEGWQNTTLRLEPRLDFLHELIADAWADASTLIDFDPYIYVTARRGVATPDNPLNRPGWHCDGFGTDDLNYVWWDRWPTRFGIGDYGTISDDHLRSMHQFEKTAEHGFGYGPKGFVDNRRHVAIECDMPSRVLYRLTPFVVHTTPLVPAPGGMRSFVKVSVSQHRYNLIGNSRNHLLTYQWPMYDRAEIRNDPYRAGHDFVVE